ncbi:hypothetical protein D3C76_1142340 [compost metagenome]
MVSSVRSIRNAGFGRSTRNMVAPTSSPSTRVRAMMMLNAAPSAPVINHLVPLMMKPSAVATAVVFICAGSAPAPGCGSVMQKQERVSPATMGTSQRACCSGVATCSSMCMLPSSGAAQLSATGPSIE